MSKIYKRLKAWFSEWLLASDYPPDEWPGFSARDWADLPPHHPLAERPCRC